MKRMSLVISAFYLLLFLGDAMPETEEIYDIYKYFPVDIGNEWAYQIRTIEDGISSSEDTVDYISSKEKIEDTDIYVFNTKHSEGLSVSWNSLGKEGFFCIRF